MKLSWRKIQLRSLSDYIHNHIKSTTCCLLIKNSPRPTITQKQSKNAKTGNQWNYNLFIYIIVGFLDIAGLSLNIKNKHTNQRPTTTQKQTSTLKPTNQWHYYLPVYINVGFPDTACLSLHILCPLTFWFSILFRRRWHIQNIRNLSLCLTGSKSKS